MLNRVRCGEREFAPSKVVCVGRNYADHAKELGNAIPDEVVFFLKPNSAISDELISFIDEPLHYELEIAFLVENSQYLGVGLGIDVTKRELQSRLKKMGLPWERAKAFNHSATFSNFVAIPTSFELLHFTLEIDGQRTQQGGVFDMLFSPEQILHEAGRFLCFEDGDIVMTGTPKGVGVIEPGTRFSARLFHDKAELLSMGWHAL